MAVIVGAFVALASIVLVLSAVGLAVMRTAPDRLHYVGPVSTVAPILVALAIVVEDGFTSQAGLKSLCVALAIVVTGPFVSYATLRAVQTRSTGSPEPVGSPDVQS